MKMHKLRFNEKTHTYYINDTEVPSVTSVSGKLNDFSKIPPGVLQRKANWGTQIDSICEWYLTGSLDFTSLSDAYKRILEQFVIFLDKEGKGFDFKNCVKKYRGGHPKLMFAGESDLIIPEQAVIDIKSRKPKPVADRLQLMGYRKIYEFNYPDTAEYGHFILSLFEKKYIFLELDKTKAEKTATWSRFRYILEQVWNEIELNKKLKIWRNEK